MTSIPSTPISHRSVRYNFRPQNSSPLVSPSHSSPLAPSPFNQKPAPERRRLQFKSQTSISPLSRSHTHPTPPSASRQSSASRARSVSWGASPSTTASSSRQAARPQFNHPEDPQKSFLRERIKAKCIERAQKARERAVKKRRYTGYSDRSSDGFDIDDAQMDDEDDRDEDDDDVMSDELFRRIMTQVNHRTEHSYRLSYALEVGSSFDPDMEDVTEWENEIQGPTDSGSEPSIQLEWDDEELEAYAEECARQAALDGLGDIPEEELFSWSDVEDILHESPGIRDDMDLS
ncbi:hypothetical protein NP233_g250 [Leucocoprinus birnbaumii]|uniref:Uncharacterized protein n=1 Tax=Leucocoprinus birnbaumii TaxID=56174 RepID=A0AAD5W412_9AGAR|nr:hypothetical protein NP233_g250 [Leucocoprinus birnbaumii]